MSNKNSQFLEINCLFVLTYRSIGYEHSAAKKLTSVLKMTQPISDAAWKRHAKAISDAAVAIIAW